MLDIKLIRERPEEVKSSIKKRGLNLEIEEILELDKEYREVLKSAEELRAKRNQISKDKGRPSLEAIEEAKKIKEELQKSELLLAEKEQKLNELLLAVPNLLDPDVPKGKDENDNVELRSWGGKPEFKFKAKDHEELGRNLDLIDLEAGAQVSGSGFFFLKNEAALLEMALVKFVFDLLVKKGFSPMIAPELVRGEAARGTGYIPKREEPDIYKIEGEDLWLSATAEIPLTAYHVNQILKEDELPKKYAGFSSCFRKEAGAYGKHKKGIYRVHQFDKVEIYQFAAGELETSMTAFKEIVELEEEIYQKLKIPYRVVNICGGDMSAPAYIKYDLEYWSPVDKTYREMTSCSNCTDFQARRLNIRFKKANGELDFVHTLNGTAITSTRTIIAILENYQQKNGSVAMPKALQKYLGFKIIKNK